MNDFDTQFAAADSQFDAAFGELVSYTAVGSDAVTITAVVSGPVTQIVNGEDGRGTLKTLTCWFSSDDVAAPQRGDMVTYGSVNYVYSNEVPAGKTGCTWKVEFENFARTKLQSKNLDKRK